MRVAEIENVAVRATGKTSSSAKIRQIHSRNVSDDQTRVRRISLGRSAVFKWHNRFAQGRDSLEDDEHTGRPTAVRTEIKIQEVATLVRGKRS
jgi:transposase